MADNSDPVLAVYEPPRLGLPLLAVVIFPNGSAQAVTAKPLSVTLQPKMKEIHHALDRYRTDAWRILEPNILEAGCQSFGDWHLPFFVRLKRDILQKKEPREAAQV